MFVLADKVSGCVRVKVAILVVVALATCHLPLSTLYLLATDDEHSVETNLQTGLFSLLDLANVLSSLLSYFIETNPNQTKQQRLISVAS